VEEEEEGCTDERRKRRQIVANEQKYAILGEILVKGLECVDWMQKDG